MRAGVSWRALRFVFSEKGMEIKGEVVLITCAVTFYCASELREKRNEKQK